MPQALCGWVSVAVCAHRCALSHVDKRYSYIVFLSVLLFVHRIPPKLVVFLFRVAVTVVKSLVSVDN